MRILSWLGISVALAVMPLRVHAADSPAAAPSPDASEIPAEAPAAPRAADEPDAIGNLNAPETQPNAAVPSTPVDASDDRIGVAAHQLEMKEYADASRLLTDIVAEQERRTSRYDPSLVVPLTMLGDAQSGESKYADALRSYEQAQHIARVEGGLHTTEQIDIVYKEANTLASMGKIDKANDRQEYAYETLERKYGPFNPELVPGLFHLAAWYDRTANIFAARGLYERALQIIERGGGENDPLLVPALRGVANTYREERFPPYQVAEEREPIGSLGGAGLAATGPARHGRQPVRPGRAGAGADRQDPRGRPERETNRRRTRGTRPGGLVSAVRQANARATGLRTRATDHARTRRTDRGADRQLFRRTDGVVPAHSGQSNAATAAPCGRTRPKATWRSPTR